MIKLFTHNDLDGVGCVLLSQLAFGKEGVDFETCKHEDINEKVALYLSEKHYENYTHCYITDIAVNDEMIQRINTLFDEPDKHFSIIDHHISAISLNDYNWCHIQVTDEHDTKCCGTSLFYHTLLNLDTASTEPLLNPLVIEFVEKIRRFDVWDWQALDDIEAKKLNDLLSIFGKERFIDYWLERFHTDCAPFSFDATQTLLLELRQNEIDHYIENRAEEMIVKEIKDYKVGIVFANRFQSEMGNALALLHPELDFIAMINIGGGVSCRCVKEDVDLASFAASFGGGGHKKAAGFRVSDTIRELVIKEIFHLES